MFIQYLTTDPEFFWVVCITVVFSVCVHELSHGIVAIWHGDRTPIERGHMTLNPVKHMGINSLILLAAAGIAWGAMPISPSRLRGWHARALVAAAGPASNVIMAAVALVTVGLMLRFDMGESDSMVHAMYWLRVFGFTNVSLAIFNLLPVPPLDGSNVLADFSPDYARLAQRMRSGGQSAIVFLVIFFFAGNAIFPASIWISKQVIQFTRGG
jgi:Zn-dependent protease